MNNWLGFSLNPQDLSIANESQADTQPRTDSNIGCYGLTSNSLHEESYQTYGNLNESQGKMVMLSFCAAIYSSFPTIYSYVKDFFSGINYLRNKCKELVKSLNFSYVCNFLWFLGQHIIN